MGDMNDVVVLILARSQCNCCALCPGVVDWHNCGIVLGALEFGLGLVCTKTLTLYIIHGNGGPSNVFCNGPTPWKCS